MAWIYLVLAGVLEIVWAFYMKKSAGFTLLVPSTVTIVTMIASFALLSIAMRTLPLGTAYTIWTGIGGRRIRGGRDRPRRGGYPDAPRRRRPDRLRDRADEAVQHGLIGDMIATARTARAVAGRLAVSVR